MDTELRRYLNGLFVLLTVNIGVTLVQSPHELANGLLIAGIIGSPVYVLLIKPEWMLPDSSDE